MSGRRSSTAVMARRSVAADSLDYFPTPAWGTRALCETVLLRLLGDLEGLRRRTCWEPACGEGHMARPLAEYFGTVHASDIYPHGFGEVGDFLGGGLAGGWAPPGPVDWVITNPPFKAGEAFARRALEVAATGVALLLRTAWLESAARYRLFQEHPFAVVCPFVERLPMVEGRLDREAESATSYSWFVWLRGDAGMRVLHIPPCRDRLDRDADWRGDAGVGGTPLFSGSVGGVTGAAAPVLPDMRSAGPDAAAGAMRPDASGQPESGAPICPA